MSVEGDKTRMDQLSRSDECYVRASPTRGVLGGIAEHTADVITLCEAGTIYGSEDFGAQLHFNCFGIEVGVGIEFLS